MFEEYTDPLTVEPVAAQLNTGKITIRLRGAVSVSLTVALLDSALSSVAQTRYNQLGVDDDILGTIPAGRTSAVFSLTNSQLAQALQYGIRIFPPAGMVNVDSSTYAEVGENGASITYELINPATRGRISDLSPGNYSTIIASEGATVRYTYHHDYGGYTQAYLSVIAENLDTGAAVTILRKSSVSVADGARGSFTIPANTLSAGRWNLTICAAPAASANYYPDSSDFWTTGQTFQYVVRDNPDTSSADCDGRPIPEISWEAVSQKAYQVRFGDYDSGARAGSVSSFVVPKIFEDGAYPLQVRTATSDGMWSDWSQIYYAEIRNVQPEGSITLTAATEGALVRLTWEERCPVTEPLQDSSGNNILDSASGTILGTRYIASADRYAVMRDGKLIATTTESMWVDRTGGGEYQIFAIHGRYYIPSNAVYAVSHPAADMLTTDGGYTWLALKFTPERKSQPESIRTGVTYAYYAGREKPIAFSSGERERTKQFSYIFRRQDRRTAQKLRELEGTEVLIKTTRGEAIHGIIDEMSWGDARYPIVSFNVRETEGEEDRVEYPT